MYYIQSIFKFTGSMLTALPLAVFVRAFLSLRMRKLGITTTRGHEIGAGMLIMYCGGLASVTLDGNASVFSAGAGQPQINIIPFRFVYDVIFGCFSDKPLAALINIIGNIALFIPFGFALSLLWRGAGKKKTVLASAAASLAIEIFQLMQTGRVTDIDDIILNTFGGLTGYLLFRLLKPEAVNRFRVTHQITYSDIQE